MSVDAAPLRWVCCQQGAREHYAVPRAAESAGALAGFVTDIWVGPGSGVQLLPGPVGDRLSGRYHPAIPASGVRHFTRRFLAHDAWQKLTRRDVLAKHSRRNELFDRLTAASLPRTECERLAVFAYSYSCRDTLLAAKRLGHAAVLGQFDPGPLESDIVDDERMKHPEYHVNVPRYPGEYFARWREEISIADRIVVNSEWSADCLRRSGVPAERLRVLPLVYEPPGVPSHRCYPSVFTTSRPLRVLYLGQVILRKGIAPLLSAADLLRGTPVEFCLVGPTDVSNLPDLVAGRPNVSWSGPVPRSAVDRHYAEADVFILPTLSDGFALTQIEAIARGLPVIATRRCGEVVIDGKDGIILSDATPGTIEAAIRRLLGNPSELQAMSGRCRADGFRLGRLTACLAELALELEWGI